MGDEVAIESGTSGELLDYEAVEEVGYSLGGESGLAAISEDDRFNAQLEAVVSLDNAWISQVVGYLDQILNARAFGELSNRDTDIACQS